MTTNDLPTLPPRVDQQKIADKERVYRTALTMRDYLRLEHEAVERGLTPYSLTRTIMTMYINKQVVVLSELKPDHQKQLLSTLQQAGYLLPPTHAAN